MPTLLEPKETGAFLGKSVQTLAYWRTLEEYKRKLPYLKIGGQIRYDREDVLKFLESCRSDKEAR